MVKLLFLVLIILLSSTLEFSYQRGTLNITFPYPPKTKLLERSGPVPVCVWNQLKQECRRE